LHTVRLEDNVLRQRLNTLICSIPDVNTAFGIEIRTGVIYQFTHILQIPFMESDAITKLFVQGLLQVA